VSIAGQASALFAANMSYAAPVVKDYITAWELAGQSGARTRGGQFVLVEGTNFGPAAEHAIDRVSYGPTGVEYSPCPSPADCNCTIITDHVTINCTTVEGTGRDHRWVVVVSGQLYVSCF
jgi:hypothetical protein